MHVLILLLGTCARVWAVPEIDPPHYVDAANMIKDSIRTLTENILSMDGRVPNLLDPRRHYIEIVHSIFFIAQEAARNCLKFDYLREYQILINLSVPEAVFAPQKVIESTNTVINDFHRKTQKMQDLIKNTCTPPLVNKRDCDGVLDTIVKSDPARYKIEANVLLVAGDSARAFNENHNEYRDVSARHEAHKFVIDNPEKLKAPVFKLIDLLRLIRPGPLCNV